MRPRRAHDESEHLLEIDQTGESLGAARAKEQAARAATDRFLREKTPAALSAMVEAYDDWAVMVGAPTIEVRPNRAITLEDLQRATRSASAQCSPEQSGLALLASAGLTLAPC